MNTSLNEQEIQLFSQEFQKELVRLVETSESQSHWVKMIMPRHKIQDIIQHLKGVAPIPPGKLRTWVESRKFKVFNKPSVGLADVLMEPTKDKLSLGDSSDGTVFPRYLRVVAREDIFDTLLRIHLQHNHSTLRETLHLIRSVISNVPRYLVHKFILLCPVCSNNGATTNSVGLPYTPSRRCMIKARRRRKLMDQFQVDVLDLKSNPDGGYSYILHCMDHITGFHWLFPLAEIDAVEVAQNLVWGIFSLFGFPTELVSDYGKEFASEVIEQVVRLWPDELHIKNFLEGSSYKGDITRRNTRYVTHFIDDMAAKKAELGDTRLKWSEWLPEIQFMMNATVSDVRTGKTPYEKVFRMQPITKVSKNNFRTYKSDHSEVTIDKSPLKSDLKITAEQQLVTEEIVDTRDTAIMHHTMDLKSSNVVVVDVAGVEHQATLATSTTTAVGHAEDVLTSEGGYHFSSIETPEGTTYTILPSTPAASDGAVPTDFVLSEHHIQEQPHYIADDHVAEMVDVSESVDAGPATTLSYGGGRIDNLRLEDQEYMDDLNSATENCVTLSADGDELEVAKIRPTVQQVKIAAGGTTGFRIDRITRNVEYLKNKNPDSTVQFKPASPVKNYHVIQLNKYSVGQEASFTSTPRTVVPVKSVLKPDPGTASSSMISAEYGYSTISPTRTPLKRTISSTIRMSPVKKLATESNANSLTARSSGKFPTTIRTNIVSRPQLKIPAARKGGISKTTVMTIPSTGGGNENFAKGFGKAGQSTDDTSEDDDGNEYGVLSEEEVDDDYGINW